MREKKKFPVAEIYTIIYSCADLDLLRINFDVPDNTIPVMVILFLNLRLTEMPDTQSTPYKALFYDKTPTL